jgi:hypothetical protein
MEHETGPEQPPEIANPYPDPSGAVQLEIWLVTEERCFCAALSMSRSTSIRAPTMMTAPPVFSQSFVFQESGALTSATESLA